MEKAYAAWRAQPPALFWTFDDIRPDEARELCREVVENRGSDWLTSEETRRVLNGFGLPMLPAVVARSADDAARNERGVVSSREAAGSRAHVVQLRVSAL